MVQNRDCGTEIAVFPLAAAKSVAQRQNLLLLGDFLNKPIIWDLFGETLYKPLTLGKMQKYTCVHVSYHLA